MPLTRLSRLVISPVLSQIIFYSTIRFTFNSEAFVQRKISQDWLHSILGSQLKNDNSSELIAFRTQGLRIPYLMNGVTWSLPRLRLVVRDRKRICICVTGAETWVCNWMQYRCWLVLEDQAQPYASENTPQNIVRIKQLIWSDAKTTSSKKLSKLKHQSLRPGSLEGSERCPKIAALEKREISNEDECCWFSESYLTHDERYCAELAAERPRTERSGNADNLHRQQEVTRDEIFLALNYWLAEQALDGLWINCSLHLLSYLLHDRYYLHLPVQSFQVEHKHVSSLKYVFFVGRDNSSWQIGSELRVCRAKWRCM